MVIDPSDNQSRVASNAAQRPTQQSAVTRLALRPSRALALPLLFTLALFLFGLLPSARENAAVRWAFWGAGALLLVWNAILLAAASRSGRTLTLEVVLRKQHYLQACAQLCIFAYWGWYWREVYAFAEFIAAQLILAYAFDSLLTWSRRSTFTLGFGPFPIVLSINLFLWFKLDWFYLQLLLVAVGFAGKEFCRWNKDGRRTHIFNPSSLTLGIFSIVLILTGSSHITWGTLISFTQFYPPYIYELIFLVSLPALYLWGVVTVTLSAAVTVYLLGLSYVGLTGSEIFPGSYIGIAVFLGMNLLITDPSTSPRTEFGRILFGMLYGLSIIVVFSLLTYVGTPAFYDKLLAVPILNLMIQGIDRAARSSGLKRFDPSRLGRSLMPRRRNLAYITLWAVFFIGMQYQSSSFRDSARLDEKALKLMAVGRQAEAAVLFREVVQNRPEYGAGYYKLGRALLQSGQPRAAVEPLRRAAELEPDETKVHTTLALALSSSGRPGEAVRHYQEAIRLDPDWLPALNGLAWLEATNPAVLNPREAVRIASHAAELTQRRNPMVLNALAAAYAAAGRFPEAVKTAEAAEALAVREKPKLAAQIRERLNLYRAGRPYVMSATTPELAAPLRTPPAEEGKPFKPRRVPRDAS